MRTTAEDNTLDDIGRHQLSALSLVEGYLDFFLGNRYRRAGLLPRTMYVTPPENNPSLSGYRRAIIDAVHAINGARAGVAMESIRRAGSGGDIWQQRESVLDAVRSQVLMRVDNNVVAGGTSPETIGYESGVRDALSAVETFRVPTYEQIADEDGDGARRAARIRVSFDRKIKADTPQWIIDLADLPPRRP